MGIKSTLGQSSVSVPHTKTIKIISGKSIVNKPINKHHANPGYKSKGM